VDTFQNQVHRKDAKNAEKSSFSLAVEGNGKRKDPVIRINQVNLRALGAFAAKLYFDKNVLTLR